ncbi:nuclear transport factor 2 family protein [Pseudorhodoferax sp. Leaf265]|uniref:nuclear transport factor 2 family protein n=1 Tax=Pseudorhodoferax sp. Leaf265 TaxID=1736315 RepID=UPI001F29F232|nr:nuclear transport factor 2 family protein [Pseudorhodoferax sp. Leaf265]
MSTKRTLDHHLGAFALGLDELLRDYDDTSILVTPDKTFTGSTQIRAFFKAFIEGVDPKFWDAFKITKTAVHGEVAYLVWEAKPWVKLATDTLHVRRDRIAVQTFTPFSA